MKQTFLSILLMLLPMMASADPVEIGGIWYNLIPKGKVAEVTSNPNGDGLFSGDIVIPEKIKYEGVEYIVTKLCGGAFYNCMEVKSITLPSTIQSIGAFAVGSLENYDQFPTISVYISDLEAWCKIDFTDDVYPAFNSYNMHLNGVKIEELDVSNIKTIKSRTFMNCKSIKKLKISDGVTSIGDLAFSSCSNLTSVIIGNSVTSIGDHAFSGCSGLTAVTIGSNVTSIGSYAFSGCSGLTSVTIPNGVTSIGEYAFSSCSGLTSVTIGNSVTSIGKGAFSDTGLTSIIIPDGVTTIGNWAFSGCSGLNSITIPKSLNSMGDSAFGGCTALTSVLVSDLKTWCEIHFSNQESNPLYFAEHLFVGDDFSNEITDMIIPNGVTSITSYAFSGFSGLISVTFSNTVTNIGDMAFYGCKNLSYAKIPLSIEYIGNGAFDGFDEIISLDISDISTWCNIKKGYNISNSYSLRINGSEVEDLVIPDNMIDIEPRAFRGCAGIRTLCIPSNVNSIGEEAFCNCINLKSVIIKNNVSIIEYGAFKDCKALTTVDFPNSITSIGESAFSGCSSLSSITLPSNISCINNYTFSRCVQLSSIEIPNSVLSIGKWAFSNCLILDNVIIPEGVTKIGYAAFYNCYGLKSVTIPKSMKIIEDYAFDRAFSIENMYISDLSAYCNIEMGEGVFCFPCSRKIILNGEQIRDLKIPENVSTIQNCTFNHCSLNSVVIPYGVTTISDYSFNFSGISSVSIPNSVTTIGNWAFAYCPLTSVEIPRSVRSIGSCAFYNCSGLSDVYCKSKKPKDTMGDEGLYAQDDSFSNSAGDLAILHVPQSSIEIYKSTSPWCYLKDIVALPDPKAGDANWDDSVNKEDIDEVTNYIMGNTSILFEKAAADINKDNIINMVDIVEIVKIITGKD